MSGDYDGPCTADVLLPRMYRELRRLAAAKLAQERGEPLSIQPTDLVHEAYMRLASGPSTPLWDHRGHFFAAAGEAMRRILVERARRRRRQKRGGGWERVGLSDCGHDPTGRTIDILTLDECLSRLESLSPRHAEVVKLRYFAGLSIDETAKALGVSSSTVDDDWAYARSWLKLELQGTRNASGC
ncbi:MAG: sigma-70 family RNA polymerase sigma factor [Planctomyces sp.]|nr:sigma-70 family RNA polymerase sigma factor [Planctomyces sp.]